MQKHLEKLKSLIKYGIAAILLAVPLYPKFPFIRVPGTYVSIRLEDFLVATVSLIAFLYALPGIRKLLNGRVERAILTFLFVALVSVISGVLLTGTISIHLGILHWARRVEYFLPFFIALAFFKRRDKEGLEFFLKCLMVVVFLAFIYGYGQKHFGWPVIITQNEEYAKGIALRWVPGSQLNSTFAGHYDLAAFLVLLLPIFITLLFLLKGVYGKVALLSTIFPGLWLLANTGSRIATVAYLIAVSLSLILVKRYKAVPLVLIVSLLFFAFSSNLLARYTRIFDVVSQGIQKKLFYITPKTAWADDGIVPKRRLNPTMTPTPVPIFEDRSTSIRLNVEWPRAIRAFSKNPLLGTGFSSITLATDNDFLRLLGEVGILGFLAFIVIFFRVGNLILKTIPYTQRFKGMDLAFVAGLTGGFVGTAINAFFIDVFEASKFAIIFWFLIGILVSMLRYGNNE